MDISRIPPRDDDGNLHVLVEIPKGSRNKYEYDKKLGVIALDRTLYSAMYYPTDYGFIPCTRSEDGELLDALVLAEEPTFPGCLLKVRLIGVLTITHSSGMPEHKLLGVPISEPRFAEYRDIADLQEHLLAEIEHFFDTFKELQGSDVGTQGWKGAEEAQQVLDASVKAYERDGAS